MNLRLYAANPIAGLLARRIEPIENQRQFENRIEARSKDVTRQVRALADSIFPGLWKGGDPVDDELETLLVQEARLRWLVRVARYSEGANREALWLEAEKVLVNLEQAAEALAHFECAES